MYSFIQCFNAKVFKLAPMDLQERKKRRKMHAYVASIKLSQHSYSNYVSHIAYVREKSVCKKIYFNL